MKQSTCSFSGCRNTAHARTLCGGHYRQERDGRKLRPLRSQVTPEQRFWANVNKTDDCWIWIGASTKGYGQISVNRRKVYAHRFAWELIRGPMPEWVVIDHRCGKTLCVNPGHLRAVSMAQNSQHRVALNKRNKSGIRGVHWNNRDNAWVVQAMLNGRKYSGGSHSTLEAAAIAAKQLRAELFTHDDHDEWEASKGGAR